MANALIDQRNAKIAAIYQRELDTAKKMGVVPDQGQVLANTSKLPEVIGINQEYADKVNSLQNAPITQGTQQDFTTANTPTSPDALEKLLNQHGTNINNNNNVQFQGFLGQANQLLDTRLKQVKQFKNLNNSFQFQEERTRQNAVFDTIQANIQAKETQIQQLLSQVTQKVAELGAIPTMQTMQYTPINPY